MIILNTVLISLVIILTSFYVSLVIITLSKSEDFGERVSFKVALALPFLIIFISINACRNNFKKDKKKFVSALKMGTINYPIAIVMLFAMIRDHQAQVELYGESIYSQNKFKEVKIQKIERRKSWMKSLSNIKIFAFSENFIDDLNETLKTA